MTIGEPIESLEGLPEGFMAIESVDVYDGWILVYNPKTRELRWRDFWVTNRLSDIKKEQIEKWVEENIKLEE